MHRKFLTAAIAAAVFLSVQARAADVGSPAKAPAATVPPCTVGTASTPLSCSGFYVGAGLAGEGSNADIIGNGINGSVFAGGMTPFVDGGYQYAQGNWMFGAELDLGYTMGSKAAVGGTGLSANGFKMTEFFKVGGNLAGLLGSQTPATVPPLLASAVLAPYAGIGATQWWLLASSPAIGTVSGAGFEFDIGPRMFGDLRYTYTNYGGATAHGLAIQNDQSLMVTINYKLN